MCNKYSVVYPTPTFMMKRFCLALILCAALSFDGHSQASKPQPDKPDKPPALDAEKLVREWFRRLDALDDWWITVDGKEEPEAVVEKMVELYAPDALQFVDPEPDQLGTVMLSGHAGIRKWADNFARTRVQLAYRLQNQTLKEVTADVIMTSVPRGEAWQQLSSSRRSTPTAKAGADSLVPASPCFSSMRMERSAD